MKDIIYILTFIVLVLFCYTLWSGNRDRIVNSDKVHAHLEATEDSLIKAFNYNSRFFRKQDSLQIIKINRLELKIDTLRKFSKINKVKVQKYQSYYNLDTLKLPNPSEI